MTLHPSALHSASQPTDVWAPIAFQPGQRVRVRVSAECRYCIDPRFPECSAQALANDGRVATIYKIGHDWYFSRGGEDLLDAEDMAHDIWVTWEERRPYDDPIMEGIPFDTHFAASELIPLPDAAGLTVIEQGVTP